MSDVLTLDVGVTNLVVKVQKAGHAEPRQVGSRVYTFSGRERSFIRAEAMVVPVILVNAAPATIATVRALFARAAQVACSGDVFNNSGASVVCSGEITDEMEQGGTYWVTNLTLYEIVQPRTLTSGLGAVVLTGFAPTVAFIGNRVIPIGVGALVASGFKPTVTSSNRTSVAAGLGAITAAGFTPSVTVLPRALIGTGVLTVTGFAPTVT